MLRFYKNIKKSSSQYVFLALIIFSTVSSVSISAAVGDPVVAAPATFSATSARTAIDGFSSKLTSLNAVTGDAATAKANVTALQGKIDAAKASAYSTNSAVLAAITSAQSSLTPLSAKLLLIPAQTTLVALNAAYDLYVTAIGTRPLIDGLTTGKASADASFAAVNSQIDAAIAALTAARGLFDVVPAGATKPTWTP